MRAICIVLLVAIGSSNAQIGLAPAEVNEMSNLKLDQHIVDVQVSTADYLINKFDPNDMPQVATDDELKAAVDAAAQDLLANLNANVASNQPLDPIEDKHKVHNDDNFPSLTTPVVKIKRSASALPDNLDVEATLELYRQTRAFLDEYNVELRCD
uniref:Uncharacterized protein n=1 Tax=Caenorhabditis japonica TaxID=281687 RepID=A0A2Q4T4K8_CAEJA